MACENGIWRLHPNMYVLGQEKWRVLSRDNVSKSIFIYTCPDIVVHGLSFNHMCAVDSRFKIFICHIQYYIEST